MTDGGKSGGAPEVHLGDHSLTHPSLVLHVYTGTLVGELVSKVVHVDEDEYYGVVRRYGVFQFGPRNEAWVY